MPRTIYEALSQRDVQSAADEFRPLYDRTDGQDGYVSLEVKPRLAHDTHGTREKARRLWDALNRPNVFIKVPATAEGLPAVQQLISEGTTSTSRCSLDCRVIAKWWKLTSPASKRAPPKGSP